MIRRTFLASVCLATLATISPASAAPGFTDYKPGMVKQALASGKTVFLDFAADWCGTCRRQETVISELVKENPNYKKSMEFIRVDWDEFKDSDIRNAYKIPRRSTLLVLRGEDELGRIVAGTSKNDIKALLDKGI